MNQGRSGPIAVFPAWLQNTFVALVLFFVIIMTGFFTQERVMLSSAEGDAGYPFGCEEAGSDYATKAIYLDRSRWLIAIGATLSLTMLYALWRKRMTLLWFLTLLTIFGALIMMMTAPR